MKNINQIVSLTGVSIFMLLSTPTFADDDKVFPGSMCEWQTAHKIQEHRWSQVLLNKNTKNQWATCALVRDSVSKSPEYFSITTKGGISGACRLYIRKANGGGTFSIAHENAVYLGNNKRRFEWYKGAKDGPNFKGAVYSIGCNLKPGAYIYSYYMSEN